MARTGGRRLLFSLAGRRPIRRRGWRSLEPRSISSPASALADVRSETARLKAIGVTPWLVGDPERPTGRLVALIDPSGERSFLTDRGANEALEAGDVPDELIAGAAMIHLSGYSFFAPCAARGRARCDAARGRQADQRRSGLGGIFARGRAVRIFSPGRGARRSCFPTPRKPRFSPARTIAETQCARLAALYPLVVIKRGAAGCEAAEGSRRWRVAARPVEAIDTTGAGDAFVAAFLAAHLKGADVEAALERAAAAGAAASTTVGGRPIPTSVRPK